MEVLSLEIGGYIEFPHYTGSVFHKQAIALNCARNCLAYVIEAKHIKKMSIPKFLCGSVERKCREMNVEVSYYSIGMDFMPENLKIHNDEWLYLVNYYGQISNDKIKALEKKYNNLIVDNVEAFFQLPLEDVDTIYTCRKYFGVPDGGYLYTDTFVERTLEEDKSADRMRHLLGRFENTASEFYSTYKENESVFKNLPLRKMSKITDNIMRSYNYDKIKNIREQNYMCLNEKLSEYNKLSLNLPEGAFMYPLYISNGCDVRKKLQEKNIYIPILWPDVLNICDKNELEYDMAENILPLPCDQRYGVETMKYLALEVERCLN